jgi:16S rRNA processing protein RimM
MSDAPDWDSMVLVGQVARPHGIRGDVVVNPETDFVDERFAAGSVLWTRIAGVVEALTVARARFGGRRPVVGFAGADTVPDAERLAGAELRVPEEALLALAPGTYYLHQLVGCRMETERGDVVGEVVRVEGGAGASLLVVNGPRGEVLVPFAASLCPIVDVDGRRIQVAAPEGLLEANEPVRPAGKKGRRGRPTA